MDTTTIHALPYSEDTDELLIWPSTDQARAEALDAIIATWATGTIGARPAAGKPGRIYRATSGEVFLDVGASWVELAREPAVPVGTLAPYAGSGDPAGGSWLLADGRLVAQATYPLYFAAVGHAYNLGVDPGGGMVRLPDKRGRVSAGADDMGTAAGAASRLGSLPRARGQVGGVHEHTLTEAQMPAHGHAVSVDIRGAAENGVVGGRTPIATTQLATNTASSTGAAATGGGGAHPNLQPYEVDHWIVRVA